jgi:hypothetical protein
MKAQANAIRLATEKHSLADALDELITAARTVLSAVDQGKPSASALMTLSQKTDAAEATAQSVRSPA